MEILVYIYISQKVFEFNETSFNIYSRNSIARSRGKLMETKRDEEMMTISV